MTGTDVLTVAGLGIAVGITAWALVIIGGELWDAAKAARRSRERARGIPGAAHLHLVVAEVGRRQKCDRCSSGSTRIPCACGTDCDAPSCLGWLDDYRRDVLRGDG